MGPSASSVSARRASADIAVAFDGVCKRFGTVVANDSITFDVRAGTIHAIVGENGAGKSTLMHLLYGVHRPDAGHVRVWNRPVAFTRPRDAIAAGIGMIHQHLSLVPTLTALENIILGREPRRPWGIDLRGARERVRALAQTHALPVECDTPVGALDVGARQRVEILKALYRGARILVLDEPTTTLAPAEYEALVRSLRGFAAGGGTILYISHRLPEVFDLCDRVTVLRGGRVVAEHAPHELDAAALARLMVGDDVPPPRAAEGASATGDRTAVVSLRGISLPPRPGDAGLDRVDLTVHAGEIVGIAGVAGNGQAALARVLVGTERPAQGEVLWRGTTPWNHVGLRARRQAGLGWIPADRGGTGLVGSLSVADNLVLGRHAHAPFARLGVRNVEAVLTAAAAPLEALQVRPGLPRLPAGALSGGNQQKVLVARELEAAPHLLVAEYPTRGVDVATTARVHAEFRALRDRGGAIVMIASDLDELLAVADRVAVMYRGRIVRVVSAAHTTAQELAPLLGGVRKDDDGSAAA